MKRIYLLSLLLFTSSSLTFFGGLITFDKSKYNNDFVRLFPPHAADIRTIHKIASGKLRLVALTQSSAILQDWSGLLSVNLTSDDTSRIDLKIPFGAEVLFDSLNFYIHQGSTGLVSRGQISNWKIDTTFNFTWGFTAFESPSANQLILRTIDIAERKNFLTNFDRSHTYTLQKQVDGLLCTDGILQYSKNLNQLIYVYRYRNQFICLDTNLNLIHYGKTIDTTSIAKISVAEVDGKITMSKPPLSVNNDAHVSGNYMFVQSNLLAKNESTEGVRERRVIDVYRLVDNSYAFSFYIYNEGGSKMESFFVHDHTLVGLFKDALVVYDIPSKYLP